MRNRFFELLKHQMRIDENIFLIVADMGLGLVEDFIQEFPDRFLNVGIAEQNMIGVAAGLCNIGYKPFCYTISNFLTQRCFEQIRNDICLHNYPITLVGTSTGFDNAVLGTTHYPIDDIGCIKTLINMKIYSPSSNQGVALCFSDILKFNGPTYIRIGKGGADLGETSDINQYVIDNRDTETLLITHGNTLEYVLNADLNDVSLMSMNKIYPLDDEVLKMITRRFKQVVVVEEQLSNCGLFSILCQYFAEQRIGGTKLYNAVSINEYPAEIGDKDFFAEKYGFLGDKISVFLKNLANSGE